MTLQEIFYFSTVISVTHTHNHHVTPRLSFVYLQSDEFGKQIGNYRANHTSGGRGREQTYNFFSVEVL